MMSAPGDTLLAFDPLLYAAGIVVALLPPSKSAFKLRPGRGWWVLLTATKVYTVSAAFLWLEIGDKDKGVLWFMLGAANIFLAYIVRRISYPLVDDLLDQEFHLHARPENSAGGVLWMVVWFNTTIFLFLAALTISASVQSRSFKTSIFSILLLIYAVLYALFWLYRKRLANKTGP